jgi:hypothetical protein
VVSRIHPFEHKAESGSDEYYTDQTHPKWLKEFRNLIIKPQSTIKGLLLAWIISNF